MEVELNNGKERKISSLIGDCRGELMGIAALLLITFHAFFPAVDSVPVFRQVEDFFIKYGFLGVDIFFFLSGMGLVYSINKYSTVEFYYRRFRRIFIPFFIVGVFYAVKYHWSALHFLGAVSGVSFLAGDTHAILWFVPAIAVCYLLFPFYYRLLKRSGHPVIFTVVICAAIFITESVFICLGHYDHMLFICRIPVFLLGAMFGECRDDKRFSVSVRVMVISILTLTAGVLVMALAGPPVAKWSYFTSSVIAVSFVIPAGVVFSYTRKAMLLRKFLRFLGMISLELYCVQTVFFDEFAIGFINSTLHGYFPFNPALLDNIVVFICCVIISYLLYLLNKGIEKLTDKMLASHKDTDISEALFDSRGELMGISALMIVAYHVFLPVASDIPVIGKLESTLLQTLYWGVDVFFFLSGAGLIRSVKTHSLKEFYFRRFKRIFLPYFLIALLYFLQTDWSFLTFVKAVTGVGFIMGDIYLFIWFVPAITICYLLFPLYYRFYSRSKKPAVFTLVTAGVFITAGIIVVNMGYVFYSLLLFRIPAFLFGALLSDRKGDPDFRLTKKVSALCIPIMIAGIILISGIFPQILIYRYLISGFVGVPSSILISAVNMHIGKDMILRRAARAIGKISLELYCVHPYFFNVYAVVFINTYLPMYFETSPDLLINICVMICSIALGYLLYFINRLFCKLLDRIL
ncbi:MAG: acyltransferase family protein [Saccharofermentans sp.]|nr:acyltransferase family protein [Saccharofermentans sp.]